MRVAAAEGQRGAIFAESPVGIHPICSRLQVSINGIPRVCTLMERLVALRCTDAPTSRCSPVC